MQDTLRHLEFSLEIVGEWGESLLACSTEKGVDFLISRSSRLGDPSSLEFKPGAFDVDLEDGIHAASKMDAGEPLPPSPIPVRGDGRHAVRTANTSAFFRA